jgi:aminopeptidase YwaD
VRLVIFLTFLCHHLVQSQDTVLARRHIQKLCSKKFAGRGYVQNGGLKSAKYIGSELKKAKLEPMVSTYFQGFTFPVVTFTKDPQLSFNGKELIPGIDFIVAADAPSSAITTNSFIKQHVVWIDKDNIVDSSWRQNLRGTQNLYFVTQLRKSIPKVVLVYVIDTLPADIEKTYQGFLRDLKAKANTITLVKNKLTWSVGTEFSTTIHFEVLRSAITWKPSNKPPVIKWKVKTKLTQTRQQNVLGSIKGTEKPDSVILVCAHYDHLGKMGKSTVFPGANDNAAGVAMLLDLAKYYQQNPPKYTMVFVAFAGEEAGLIGSYYFVKHPVLDLQKLRFVLNLDLVGTGETGMTVVNATIFTKEFAILDSINTAGHYLPQMTKRGKASISDHYFFTEAGIPSFFWYQSGPRTSYHDVYDIPETLSLAGYLGTFELAVRLFSAIGN